LAATDSLLGLGKMGDLKQRLLFLLGALVVFRIGSYIPVPGIDPEQLRELLRVYSRHRDVRADAKDDERAKQEQQAALQVAHFAQAQQ